MTKQSKIFAAIFFAGFFAKDVIDDLLFLMIDKYPIPIFGFEITATSHKVMLVISTAIVILLLYYNHSLKTTKK